MKIKNRGGQPGTPFFYWCLLMLIKIFLISKGKRKAPNYASKSLYGKKVYTITIDFSWSVRVCDIADYSNGSSSSQSFGRRTVVHATTAPCPSVPVSSPGTRCRLPGPSDLQSLEDERRRTLPCATALQAWSTPPRRPVPTSTKHNEKVSQDFDLRGSMCPTSANFMRYSGPVNSLPIK